MTIKSANREINKLTVNVEVEKEVFEAGISKAYLKNRKYIAVPGFRKGKAPRKMIENLYGAQVFVLQRGKLMPRCKSNSRIGFVGWGTASM